MVSSLTNVKIAHHIRNCVTKTYQATCDLRARYRWCLTGTPIHNTLDDYAALLAFIRVSPFTGPGGKATFNNFIESPLNSFDKHELGIRRLRKLIAATCLRRTKDHLQDQLSLPSRTEIVHQIELTHEERRVYDFFKSRASSLVMKLRQKSQINKTSWSTMLSIIGFLRSICNHGGELLPEAAMEMYNTHNRFAVGSLQNSSTLSEASTCPTGLSADLLYGSPQSPTRFDDLGRAGYQPSSKVTALIRNIQNEQLENKSGINHEAPVKR